MNDGLKIILARMDTNPEEFFDKRKWRHLVESDWPMFTKEEQEAYSTKLRSILLDKFSEEVLKELMDEDDAPKTMKYKASERYAVGWTDARESVSLTTGQVALAQKLGMRLEDYAKALSKQGI
jgi:hypothetical protein